MALLPKHLKCLIGLILFFTISSKKNTIIYYSVDNVMNEFLINGVPININPDALNIWSIGKVIEVPLNPGDVIQFQGINEGGPAGIVATIIYYDEFNTEYRFNTGDNGWTCNGKSPLIQHENRDRSSPWIWITNVEASARWIWGTDGLMVLTYCTFSIPCNLK